MPRVINQEKCNGCGKCENVCRSFCIREIKGKKRIIDTECCIDCGSCQRICPIECISKEQNSFK